MKKLLLTLSVALALGHLSVAAEPVVARAVGVSIFEAVATPDDYVLRKSLEVRCGQGFERLCVELCGTDFGCHVPERHCRNCAGTADLRLMDFFKNVGTTYLSAGPIEGDHVTQLAQYLREGAFVAISSLSPYNFWTAFDHPELRARFESLCEAMPSAYPVVLFDVNAWRQPTSARWVLCNNENGFGVFQVARRAIPVIQEVRRAIVVP